MQSNGIPQASQPIDTNLMWATIILTFCLFGLAQPNTRLDFRYSLRLFSVRVAGAIITVRFDSHVIVKNIRTVSSPRGSFSCTPLTSTTTTIQVSIFYLIPTVLKLHYP